MIGYKYVGAESISALWDTNKMMDIRITPNEKKCGFDVNGGYGFQTKGRFALQTKGGYALQIKGRYGICPYDGAHHV